MSLFEPPCRILVDNRSKLVALVVVSRIAIVNTPLIGTSSHSA